MSIRPELEVDAIAVRAVHQAAFETSAEADLVDSLRRRAAPIVSLVAEEREAVVGHILFTPVALASGDERAMMGLAPMAVAPTRQRCGIGSALVRAGLERCREMGTEAVVVLGHPEYYPRFGFAPAVRFGLRCRWNVPPEVFMALELRTGALDGLGGLVLYDAAFDDL